MLVLFSSLHRTPAATISYLTVTEPITEYASPATTVPLDLALWHRRLAHHNLTDMKVLIECKLVTGMKSDVKTMPDPLCEPCLAGQMHADPLFECDPSRMVLQSVLITGVWPG